MKHAKKRFNEELKNLPDIETARLLDNQANKRNANGLRNDVSFPTIASTTISPPDTMINMSTQPASTF